MAGQANPITMPTATHTAPTHDTNIGSSLAGPGSTTVVKLGCLWAPSLGAAPGLPGYGRAIGPRRGRRTRRHRTDTVEAHQIPGRRGRKPLPQFLFRHGSRVWRRRDWVTLTDDYAMIVHGRSDATLNRNGVRMGSSDIYHAVKTVSDVTESLIVGVERPDGGDRMRLFVSLAPGAVVDDRLRSAVGAAIGEGAAPPHAPDDIIQIDAVPHPLTGKKQKIPVKRILLGHRRADVVDLGALDRPDVLVGIADLAAARSPS
jgi:acetoacetyl-CoA synthetase